MHSVNGFGISCRGLKDFSQGVNEQRTLKKKIFFLVKFLDELIYLGILCCSPFTKSSCMCSLCNILLLVSFCFINFDPLVDTGVVYFNEKTSPPSFENIFFPKLGEKIVYFSLNWRKTGFQPGGGQAKWPYKCCYSALSLLHSFTLGSPLQSQCKDIYIKMYPSVQITITL